ncbi:unnamed protein product [Microthlaspi erraticum]|uniref:NAD-dependent protein deacylase n=1 Tax=Microthlaspi erraticum TaxID=1685480 RepID=A0A6D2IJ37_9BRAS|nr:unnamed protein product [Microthlaspi erraticum]
MLQGFHFNTRLFEPAYVSMRRVFRGVAIDLLPLHSMSQPLRSMLFRECRRFVRTTCRVSIPGVSLGNESKAPPRFLRDKKIVPDADPPHKDDIHKLYQLFEQSSRLTILTGAGISTECGIPDYRRLFMFTQSDHSCSPCSICVMMLRNGYLVQSQWSLSSYSSRLTILTGAGISTECGIPDYRSPNGAYSSGFKPITHQEFTRSSRARRRYWARSYAGWRRFTAAQPGSAHTALASLEKAGRIDFMITQNVDRLHHRAGNSPLELHGTVYTVMCLDCGFSFPRDSFQDQLKALNPKWAEAIESIEHGDPGSEKSFGMKQRPDGDIEIDEKFWEEGFHIPVCEKCQGVLKPDVIFFGDNIPKERATQAMEVAKQSDAFLVLGSSLMTMSAFRLVRAAHEAGAMTAIVNIGETRADDFVPLKIGKSSVTFQSVLP